MSTSQDLEDVLSGLFATDFVRQFYNLAHMPKNLPENDSMLVNMHAISDALASFRGGGDFSSTGAPNS